MRLRGVLHVESVVEPKAVTVKCAESVVPDTAAAMVTAPAVEPTVTCVLAIPVLSVRVFGVDNVAEPEATENVTVAPEIGAPAALDTCTTNDCASVVPMIADCPLPLNAVTEPGTTVLFAVGETASPPQPVSAITINVSAPTSFLPEQRFEPLIDVCI